MRRLLDNLNLPREPRRPYCSECGQRPHAYGCPLAPDPPRVYVCAGCGDDICEGDDYWDILGEQFCERCIHDAKKEAVYDPY